jgi:hypothetical protein
MAMQKIIASLFVNANEIIQLLRNAYIEIQQEPIVFSLTGLIDSLQKSAGVYQQCNSKKAALMFFVIFVARDFFVPIARRVLADICFLIAPLIFCFLLMPNSDWNTLLISTFFQFIFLLMRANFL